MPNARLPLLLTLASLSATATADAQTVEANFDRVRPGSTFSVGPRGMPRGAASEAKIVDPAVKPAAFQPFGEAKPIEQAAAPTPPEQPAPQPAANPPADFESPDAQPTPISKPAPTTGRRLLGGGQAAGAPSEKRSSSLPGNPLKALAAWRPSSKTVMATGGGLAIAIGLVISFTWLLRSLAPKASRPLPRDVVEVLGKAPLGAKQTTQLVRVGGKLLLVAITPEGVETLTEITDPGEVARLIAACETGSGKGQNAEFDAMLREMADERTAPGFLGGESSGGSLGFADGSFDPRSLAAAYANTPGGRGDA